MADIFISYASQDRTRIEPLAKSLEEQGWSVFWDRTIPAGKTWREVIGTALKTARSVVVAWSETSVESRWVQEEADLGLERNILVPVFIDEVRPPLGFGTIQAANLVGWDAKQSSPEFEKFIADLSAVLGPAPKEVEEEERRKAEVERAREQEEEKKRREEERRQGEAERQKREEAQRKAEVERKRKEAELAKKAEAERRAEEQRKRKDVEKMRQAEEEGKREVNPTYKPMIKRLLPLITVLAVVLIGYWIVKWSERVESPIESTGPAIESSSRIEGLETSETLLFSVKETFSGKEYQVNSLAFSPDGRLLASGGSERKINLWDTTNWKLFKTLTYGPVVGGITFSPDGRLLAAGGHVDYRITLWDTEEWKPVHTINRHYGPVWSVAFSPDGRMLASGSGGTNNHKIKLWDTTSWNLLKTLTDHRDGVHAISFSPDGRLLASGSRDETVKLWNTENWSLLRTLTGHVQEQPGRNGIWGTVADVAFSPDGLLLASGSYDNTIKLWSITDWRLLKVLNHEGVFSIAFSLDGQFLASGGQDETIKLWNTSDWRLLQTLTGQKPHRGASLDAVTFSPDGRLLAATELDMISLWERRNEHYEAGD